jgi:hypothetical protein
MGDEGWGMGDGGMVAHPRTAPSPGPRTPHPRTPAPRYGYQLIRDTNWITRDVFVPVRPVTR